MVLQNRKVGHYTLVHAHNQQAYAMSSNHPKAPMALHCLFWNFVNMVK